MAVTWQESGLKSLPQCTQRAGCKLFVGAASAATSEAVRLLRWGDVGTEVPPTVHPAGWLQAFCRSGFSRDERSGEVAAVGGCRD